MLDVRRIPEPGPVEAVTEIRGADGTVISTINHSKVENAQFLYKQAGYPKIKHPSDMSVNCRYQLDRAPDTCTCYSSLDAAIKGAVDLLSQ